MNPILPASDPVVREPRQSIPGADLRSAAAPSLQQIQNRCPAVQGCALWLSDVPQRELDALAAALRRGPLDAHFFLSLAPTFHRTALAGPMAQPLVDDALARLLPRGLPRAQVAAWRQCLAGLLVLPRAAWEVACMPMRAHLTHAAAMTNTLLRAMRDALYRPHDLSVSEWNALLDEQRSRGVHDCREVARSLQVGSGAARCAMAREQVACWVPGLAVDRLERAVSEMAAVADRDAACIDPRMALPALFDAVDAEHRAVISDAGRAAVLSSLETLAGASAAPLLATSGGPGDALAQRLLAVAHRAAPGPGRLPGCAQALGEALLYALSVIPGLRTLGTGPRAARGVAAPGPCGAAAVPLLQPPGATAAATSGAAPHGGRGLLALAAGLVGGGAGLVALGWRWAAGQLPRDPLPLEVQDATRLLDSVIARDGGESLWHAIWQCVQGPRRERPEVLVSAIGDQLQANQIGGAVVATLGVGAGSDETPAPPRMRRAAETMLVPPADHAGQRRHEQLQHASAVLIEAALRAPEPAALPFSGGGNAEGGLLRSRLLTWVQAMGDNASAQHARLRAATRDIAVSERHLMQAWAALPHLDAYLAEQVATDLQSVTGHSIDPSKIRLNTFQVSETWKAWEARQLRPPRTVLYPRVGQEALRQRVRSGLLSSRTLASAALSSVPPDPEFAGLYYRGTPDTYFPAQECRELTLAQFTDAVAGRDYMAGFRRRFDAVVEAAWHGQPSTASQHYLAAVSRRLSGAATLLNAAGRLSDDARALVQVLVDFPARFDMVEPANGRALAMPGRQIEVHALAANASGRMVPLHGILLVSAADVAAPVTSQVLLISDNRFPAVEAFASRRAALQRLATEVRQQLPLRVAVNEHALWQRGHLPVVPAHMLDGDFRWTLFRHSLDLRHAQLRPPAPRSPDSVRRHFNGLERLLTSARTPVPLPLLAAAAELATLTPADIAARGAAHWLARFPADTPGALRNLGMEGARWLHALTAGRSLLAGSFPGLGHFVRQCLEGEILQRYGTAVDSEGAYVVLFSAGTASNQTASGWRHTHAQRQSAITFAECAMSRGQGLDDVPMERLGLYRSDNADFFDEGNEVADLLPAQLLAVVRGLDVQSAYLARLEAFWGRHEDRVRTILRGNYLHSCWQLYAAGSLSLRGTQLALGLFGDMDARQSQDPAYTPTPRNGTQAGWLNIHGTASTLLHISDAQGPEVLLFVPHRGGRFHEFSSDADLMGWVQRLAASNTGQAWLESAFDLADLQDGWVSNGVHSALGGGARAMFHDGRLTSPIEGEASVALVRRFRERSRRDAQTLMTSPWEAFRQRWMPRLEQFEDAVGLASVFIPALLPVVAVGGLVQLGVGVHEAVTGQTQEAREAGARTAAVGVLGLALSAPLGTARMAALADHEGARLVPALQVPVLPQGPDPLRQLAERYSQPVSLSGIRAADNGVVHNAGRDYIEQGGHTYEVSVDRAQRTWRLRDPRPDSAAHLPVRLNADGLWEPHAPLGLRGGAPEAVVGQVPVRRSSLNLAYRNALNLHLERLRSPSRDAAAADFEWGREHWQRVVAPSSIHDGSSVARMKELFVSGVLDPVQLGALSAIIERLESTLRAEQYAMMEVLVAREVSAAGGRFYPASQGLLGEASGSAAGMCTGLSRIMAVALARGEEAVVLDNLRHAIAAPLDARSAAIFAAVRDAQGAALERGTMSSTSLIATSQLPRFLMGVADNAEFILSGSQHSMVCAARTSANGQRLLMIFDPNSGLKVCASEDCFARLVNALFSSRVFAHVLGADDGALPQTLAELYGAFSTPGSTGFQFHLRQVNAPRLQAQAQARGWQRLLEPLPAAGGDG